MQMRYGDNMNHLSDLAIYDGIGKSVKTELAILAENLGSLFWIGGHTAQSNRVFSQKIMTEPRLALLIPKRSGLQFQVGFRKIYDAH